MKNFKQLIKELPSSKVVVAFGSFQPPTSVHEHLVKAVKAVAGSSADYAIYASANEDKKYNPLSVDRKVYFLNRMFPGTNFQETAEQTIVGLAKKLNEKYKVLTVVVGEDKVSDVTKQLTKANGKEYTFESIKVISTGATDPDSDVTPGVSGLRMCESAKAGKFEDFKKGLPHTLTEHDSRRLMNEVRKGLGQEPIKEQVVLAKDKIREDYFNGKIFNVGDIVESAGQQYEIVKRGSNHLLLKEESGALVSKWIQDVTLVAEQQENEMKEVSKETIRKKYKQIVKKATMSEPPVEIGKPVEGDGKVQPKAGEKVKKNESNFTEDVYTSDTKEKNYMAKDAEGNWVWRKRKIHPKRINFANSKMGGTPENVPTTMPTEAYKKKSAYEKINNRFKTLTGRSLEDAGKEWEQHRKETEERIKKYKEQGILNKEQVEHGPYEKSEENKKSADAAKKQGDMFAHHLHMADYHDNLAQWHDEKGRHNVADHHASKAASHHEQAMKLKEHVQIDEISSKLAGDYYGAATKKHLDKVGMKPNMYDRIEKDMGKKRKEGVDRALDRITGARKTNEAKETYGSWVLKQKASKTLKQKPESKEKVEESKLNPLDPHGDYKAKKKALQDIQLDRHTHKDPELVKAVMQSHADLDKEYQKYTKIGIGEERKPKSLKTLKKEIKDKESLATTNKNPPFDAFSSTNC